MLTLIHPLPQSTVLVSQVILFSTEGLAQVLQHQGFIRHCHTWNGYQHRHAAVEYSAQAIALMV